MDITPTIAKGHHIITGYGAGGFKINGQWQEGSLLITPQRMWAWAGDFDSLLALLEAAPPELLLIGTGKNSVLIDHDLRAKLKTRHIAAEAMDTGAACRTYNVLLAEGRRVAAALTAL